MIVQALLLPVALLGALVGMHWVESWLDADEGGAADDPARFATSVSSVLEDAPGPREPHCVVVGAVTKEKH